MSEIPEQIDPDSDSDVEYSDALDLDSDLKLRDEFSKPEKRSKEEDEFFDGIEDGEKSGIDDPTSDDRSEDPLKERQELEDKLTDEERENRRIEAKALKEEGNRLYLDGSNSEAAAKYSEGLDVCPLCFKEDRAMLYSNRAAVHMKTDRREAAIEDCSRAIELKPDYVKALVRRGQAYEDSDRPHEAFKDFEKVLEIDPGLKEAKLAVMRLPEKIRAKDEKLKEEMLENLKKLGNMVLKPFGLSTSNFNVVQDAKTGGYSVNFNK